MELKNNLLIYKTKFIQRRQVKKERLINLKLNYHKGLIIEFEKKLENYKTKEENLINLYHEESVSPLKLKLDGNSKNDEKRIKLLNKYDQKVYWKRRRLKVKLKDETSDTINESLKDYDENSTLKRASYVNSLENKYPHQELDQISRHNLEKKVEALEKKKTLSFQKMDDKYRSLEKRTKLMLSRNQKVIELLVTKKQKLKNSIENYNLKRHQENQFRMSELKKEIELQKSKEDFNKKTVLKLEQKLSNLQTIEKVLKDESIHLSVNGLKMYFGGVKAVNDLSFDVKKGEVFGLIGPNGAGKTTVFNCLTQFYKATAGQMILKNKENHIVDLYDLRTHDIIKEGIARSFQNVELIWELTVIDNLMVSAHSLLITGFFDHIVHTKKLYREDLVIRTKAIQILKDLDIEAYAYRSPYGLPYGILKKIELARTLMTDPSMIILDEPAAGLNDAETIDLAKVIKHINKTYDTTIFLVEHDMNLVMSICDTICAISFGKLIGIGTPKEIQNNPEVRKAYLGDDENE